jgi:hypothetical protein
MSTVRESSSSPSSSVVSAENLLFDYPEADIILRSRDFFDFRVLKHYIVHSSPILGEQVLISLDPDPQPNATPNTTDSTSLPVIQLFDTGAILFSLLSFIFPVPPILPATIEQTMELLSVAEKYKADVVLARIRNHIAQQDPPFIREDTALYIYSLAHKYGLRVEVLQAARSTLFFLPLTVEGLEDKLDMMSGACLHELWKYHERVKSNLTSDLEEVRVSNAQKALGESTCQSLTASRIPTWLDRYIEEIGRNPISFDLATFHMALSNHIQLPGIGGSGICVSCLYIPHKIHAFWAALTTAFNSSISKVNRYNCIW